MRKLRWYAATDLIYKMGPYKTQAAAWAALRLEHQTDRVHASGSYVWCEG